MDFSQLANLGEFIGGIAVFASLIYVGVQVRQSNEQARRSNGYERARANREIARDFNEIALSANDAEFVQLYRRATAAFDQMLPDEQLRMHRYLSALTTHATSAFLVSRENLVDEHYAEVYVRAWARIAGTPGVSDWWNRTKVLFHADFVKEVD